MTNARTMFALLLSAQAMIATALAFGPEGGFVLPPMVKFALVVVQAGVVVWVNQLRPVQSE